MAGIAVINNFSKLLTTRALVVRGPWNSRVSLPISPRHSQVVRLGTMASSEPPSDAARRGVHELKKAGSHIKDQAASQADNVASHTKDAAGKVAGAADNIAEKAKQAAQDAWGAAKNTAQKVKDTVAGEADEAADAVKSNANAVKRSMNSKN